MQLPCHSAIQMCHLLLRNIRLLGTNIAFGDISLFSLLEIEGVSEEHTDSIFSVLEMLKQHIPSNHRQTSNRIHGVISHMTENVIHFTDTPDILNLSIPYIFVH